MNLANLSIDELLERRNTKKVGQAKKHDEAKSRLEISKLIAENYEGFNVLRKHLIHPKSQPKIVDSSRQVKFVINTFADLGWIAQEKNCTWRFTKGTDSKEFAFVKGNWLEEYVFCAHLQAGVDEASYGQEIEWQVGDVTGKNEIDVIARRGDRLSFTSCKAKSPFLSQGATTEISGFLAEVDYWDTHFSNNQGKLLLVITADFIDEMQNNRHRYPQVVARASILNVDMIGLEDLGWDRLVGKICQHWDD